jgi:hypothetical protein
MPSLKLASASLLTLAIAACLTTAAYALPELKDHVPSTFTATGASPELLDPTGSTIKCETLTVTLGNGKLLTTTTLEAVIDFEQCQVLKLAVNSLGDKNDTVNPKLGLLLVPVKGQLCYIGPAANKEAGVFFQLAATHLEAPAAALLIELLNGSSVVALITPNDVLRTGPYTLTTKVQQECDGKKADILLEVEHNTKPLLAELHATATVTFDEDEELTVI